MQMFWDQCGKDPDITVWSFTKIVKSYCYKNCHKN